MDSLHFLADREQELRDLIHSPENRASVRAACRDVDVSLYHPEGGESGLPMGPWPYAAAARAAWSA